MYVGRFIVVGPGAGVYRVSSRSFPDRRIVARNGSLTVAPTPDAPETDNPYVAYNCVRFVGGEPAAAERAVLGNGSHVDPITEKLELGYPPRDALAESLLALDYERDDYDTPRLAGIVSNERAHVGIVRRDALLVEQVVEPTLVSTYERDAPESIEFPITGADEAARWAYDHAFEHPVCAAGVVGAGTGFEAAVVNGD